MWDGKNLDPSNFVTRQEFERHMERVQERVLDHSNPFGFVTRQEFEAHIRQIEQDIQELLERTRKIDRNTQPRRHRAFKLNKAGELPPVPPDDLTPIEMQQFVVRDFYAEAIRRPPADRTDERISRNDLHATFLAYEYQWLRRAVTDRGMSEEDASATLAARPTLTRFSRMTNELRSLGQLPGLEEVQGKGIRFWRGIAYRPWVQAMIDEPDDFDLTAAVAGQQGGLA
jgi:hypothetical protein